MEDLKQLLSQLDANSSVGSIESTFSKIAEILGYAAEAEMVHRDNLALTH